MEHYRQEYEFFVVEIQENKIERGKNKHTEKKKNTWGQKQPTFGTALRQRWRHFLLPALILQPSPVFRYYPQHLGGGILPGLRHFGTAFQIYT